MRDELLFEQYGGRVADELRAKTPPDGDENSAEDERRRRSRTPR